MAEVTAEMVKVLRDATGAGMMDCKRALIESDGDTERATEILREKGLASVAKRAGRSASTASTCCAELPCSRNSTARRSWKKRINSSPTSCQPRCSSNGSCASATSALKSAATERSISMRST